MSEPVLLYKEYIFVIDTDSFTQDFYKELVAYCTGYASEDAITSPYSEAFYDEMQICDSKSPNGFFEEEKNPFRDYIVDRENENGNLAPCCILLNRKYGINDEDDVARIDEFNFSEYNQPAPFSLGIFFEKYPVQSQIDLIKNRAAKFIKTIWKDQVKIEGYRLIIHSKYGEEVCLD